MSDLLDFSGNGAVLSECGTYRLRLDRHVGAGETIAAVFGVNPSTADETLDDATVRKWRGFGERLGWRRFIVGNVFTYRATDVRALAKVADPFGPEYDRYLSGIISEADVLIPCWGLRTKVPRSLRYAFDAMLDRLHASGKPVMHWGLTKSGDPTHPLMLGYKTPLRALAETTKGDDPSTET